MATTFPFQTSQPKIDVTLPVGHHVLQLVVEDSGGLLSAPATVVVDVVKEAVPAPVVAGIAPANGDAGGEVRAQITGQNLNGATAVQFYFPPKPPLRPILDPTLAATIEHGGTDSGLPVTIRIDAAAASGPRIFTVTTPAGTGDSPGDVTFSVQAAAGGPTIAGIDPATGRPGDQVQATITGTGLQGATEVFFFMGLQPRDTPVIEGPLLPTRPTLPATEPTTPPIKPPSIQPDRTVVATILQRGTDTDLPVGISINPDAPEGVRTFQVVTPGGTASSPSGVTFTVEGGPTRPTIEPTRPTVAPTLPTVAPTLPTIAPTLPTVAPTRPTIAPTFPTIAPTAPTIAPTVIVPTRPNIGPVIGGPVIAPRGFQENQPDVSPAAPRSVTEVKGIGPAMRTTLEQAGVANLGDLAAAEPPRIAEILGVSEVRAMGFIDQAKRMLTG